MNYIKKYTLPLIIIALVAGGVFLTVKANNEIPFFSTTQDGCDLREYEEGTVAQLGEIPSITANAGDLIEINLADAKANSFKWIIQPPTENYRVIECGRKLILSHGNRQKFQVFVAGALGDSVDAAIVEIQVGKPSPNIPDTPDNDDDTPPQPSLSKLEKLVLGWIEGVAGDDKHSEGRALGKSFLAISSIIAAGVADSSEEIIEMTKSSNEVALGDSVENWEPFRQGLRTYLNHIAKDGELQTPDDHARVWREIGRALLKVT